MEEKQITSIDVYNKNLSYILKSLCITSNYIGYNFIVESLFIIRNNPNVRRKIVKEVYTPIADKYGLSYNAVERDIRTSIESGLQKADLEVIDKFFGKSIKYHKYKPTNSEFLFTLNDLLILGYDDLKER